jgi:prophage maintenance system killer protein
MAMFTFLQLDGLEPVASEAEYYTSMMSVAKGQMSKEQLAAWLQTVVRGVPPEVTTK